MGYISEVVIDNAPHRVEPILYGSCSTAAATAEKAISLSNFVLTTGIEVTIKFVNTNTASSPTLKVGNSDAKAIYYRGSAINKDKLVANRIYTFVYDGSHWELIGDLDTNSNTTYTFADGTNGFTVTPLGGTAQTVKVTPSITNNITGSGTSGSIAKFNGVNTIADGPAFGTDTTKFLNNKGEWAVPTDTNKYHKTGSWNGLTYTATAVNSADELKFTIPNKIQTNWELNAASDNSPALLFTLDGSLTDWKIFVTSGKLSFQSATDGSTWTERAYFKDNSGDFVATSFTGSGASLTSLNASNISSGTLAIARIADSSITNAKLANSKVTIAGNNVSLGDSLTASTLTSSLGLSNALHFIGITSTALTDGSTTATLTAKSTNSLSKTTGFVDGDVVMDGDQLREYVWSGSVWRLLGITTSAAYTYPASTATNTWIAQISQGTDGRITATTGSLDTSGTWTGNAATATAIQTAGTTAQFYRGDNSWSDTISGGLFKITNNSNTVTIGSQSTSFTHIYNSATIPFIFNNSILTTTGNLGDTNYPFNNLYIGLGGAKGIYYVGTESTNQMITFLDNTSDANGNGIKIGGGGVVVVGAGESATNLSVTAGSEILYLTSDGDINIEAGGDTIANRIGLQVTTAGHIIPVKAESANNNQQNLGASDNRWAKLYIGDDDDHGDAYTPIYWNNGVPTAITPIQYCEFTIGDGKTGVKLTHEAFTAASYVTQIVVFSGESNLNSAIGWESAAGYINLTCTAVTSGVVSGYILVSRGGAITATATDIT